MNKTYKFPARTVDDVPDALQLLDVYGLRQWG